MDLLDTQSATASNDSVAGTHVPAPSPRRNTQSPVTHQLQQTLRNSASEQVRMYDYSSPSHSQDNQNNGDGASAFSAFGACNNPTIVETVQEGNSVDSDGYPIGEGHVENPSDDAQVNLKPRQSEVSVKPRTVCDSGLRSLAIDTAENLVIDTNNPGRADFVISVGALGNASGTPLDGSQHTSFGENDAEERRIVDSAAKLAASRTKSSVGMKVYSGSESSTSYNTPPSFDPCDPEVLGTLLSAPPKPVARSPTSIQFNEQTEVTEFTRSGTTSTTTGNLGGAGATSPSTSLPGSNALRQHANAGGNANPDGNPDDSPSSGDSNGNNGDGNQGGTSAGNDPQDSGPNDDDLNKVLLEYVTDGGPLQHWNIQGTIRLAELVRFSGVRDPQTYQWVLQSKRHLMRPEIIDRVTDKMHFLYQHNDGNRVQMIIDGMPLFVLTVPGTKMTPKNVTMLEDHVASTQQMCRTLGHHLLFANALRPEKLPLRAPLLFYAERMMTHPHVIPGSFDYVKKVDESNAVVIPHGVDTHGAQIVDPPVMQAPTFPTLGGTPNAGAGGVPSTGATPDLVQGTLAAMQVMTQVHLQADQRNASMSQQQARLQAATMQSNSQQLENLTNHLGNLGCEVGRAIATHPTNHSHTLQATLSHPNTVAGQSTDPRVLGSLARAVPVSVSLPTFDCGPCVQAFQPQPNDKNT